MKRNSWAHRAGQLPKQVERAAAKAESDGAGATVVLHAVDWLASFSQQAQDELRRSQCAISDDLQTEENRGRNALKAKRIKDGAKAAKEMQRLLKRILRAQLALAGESAP